MKLQDHISTGNSKVPYYVMNMTSAKDCVSRDLGLCQIAEKCYADKAETQYPSVLPYRRRQTRLWDNMTAVKYVTELVKIQSRARKMPKVLRFSESGDFRNQADVTKMVKIAKLLKAKGWKVYGYTARTDLYLDTLCKYAVVNLSNGYGRKNANRFKVVEEPTGNNYVCRGDCRKCRICLNVKGKVIEVIKH